MYYAKDEKKNIISSHTLTQTGKYTRSRQAFPVPGSTFKVIALYSLTSGTHTLPSMKSQDLLLISIYFIFLLASCNESSWSTYKPYTKLQYEPTKCPQLSSDYGYRRLNIRCSYQLHRPTREKENPSALLTFFLALPGHFFLSLTSSLSSIISLISATFPSRLIPRERGKNREKRGATPQNNPMFWELIGHRAPSLEPRMN